MWNGASQASTESNIENSALNNAPIKNWDGTDCGSTFFDPHGIGRAWLSDDGTNWYQYSDDGSWTVNTATQCGAGGGGGNSAPSITSPNSGNAYSANYAENGTSDVADVDATDPDGDPIVYSIDGDDAGDFSIDASTGVISLHHLQIMKILPMMVVITSMNLM